MARTAVTVTALAANTESALIAGTTGTAIDATNSHKITPPAGVPIEELVIVITNTTGSTKIATVKAGANPPADATGVGDKTVSLTDGSTTPQSAVIMLSSARFAQANGDINIDIAAAMTGRIACFSVAKAF